MANSNIGFSASIQPKKGRLYAVISVAENGKKKAVWRSLGLEEGAGKNKINKAYSIEDCKASTIVLSTSAVSSKSNDFSLY